MGITELPDEAIEAFFLGDAHEAWEQNEALTSLADQVVIGATGPVPTPSPALRVFLGEPDGVSAPAPEATRPLAAVPAPQPNPVAAGPAPSERGTNVVPLFRRLRLTVGVAAAAGVAAATLAVTATTGVLPEPVMQAVSWVVEAVTPFEIGDRARTTTGGARSPVPGPGSTVPLGPLGSGVGPGGVPGQPTATTPATGPVDPNRPGATRPDTPPISVPPGPSGPVQPPRPTINLDLPPVGPVIPPTPAPPAPVSPPVPVSPPADPGRDTPATSTSIYGAQQSPAGGTVPPTGPGAQARR